MSRVWSVLRAAGTLSRKDWRELVEAQAALIGAQLLVWRRPVGRLITESAGASTLPRWGPRELLTAEHLARALNRAAKYGLLRPQCLVRALALTRLLDSKGVTGSSIRIGVRWEPRAGGTGTFTAHAWVVGGAEGAPVGDSVSNIAPFSVLAVVRGLAPSDLVPR